MKPDDFLDPVMRALLFPPEESVRLIGDVAAGAPRPPLRGAAAYVRAALGDAAALLRPPYRPPASALVAFPREGDRLDVMRALWTTADGRRLHMGQTRFVIAVWGKGLTPDGAAPDAVDGAARLILDLPPDYSLALWGRATGRSFGGRDPEREGWEDADWPHWRDELRWWSGEGRLAFVTLKASGGPTRQPISYDPDENSDWF